MKQLIIISLLANTLFSCGTGNESDKNTDRTKTDSTQQTKSSNELTGCYVMNVGKDTAHLKLNINGISVKGTLAYRRYEKDSNDGIVEGEIKQDIIKLWYRFQSEGIISLKEVYFKIAGDKLIEGYGDMEMHNDSAYFSFPTALRYEENHPYIKENCSQ